MKEMKDMTQTEALAEAIRRWGPSGTIKFRPPLPARKQRGRLARYCCIAGNGIAGAFYSIEGQGNSWREAFDDSRPRGSHQPARTPPPRPRRSRSHTRAAARR